MGGKYAVFKVQGVFVFEKTNQNEWEREKT
jgi:hypothetical protein